MSPYRYKQRRKRGLLLTVECHGCLVNVESSRVGKKQNQRSTTTRVKNESGELSMYSKVEIDGDTLTRSSLSTQS